MYDSPTKISSTGLSLCVVLLPPYILDSGNLPKMVVNYITKQTPMCVAVLRDVVEAEFARRPPPPPPPPLVRKKVSRKKKRTNPSQIPTVNVETSAGAEETDERSSPLSAGMTHAAFCLDRV